MKPLSAPQIRNVAVVGHNTVKTTLVAALLYAAGATTRPGRIEDGTCLLPYSTEEIDRKISINLSCAHAIHRDTRINFLDAPGYGIFAPEARSAVRCGRRDPRARRRVGRRGPDREDVEVRERVQPPGPVRRQPHGPRAGVVRPVMESLQKKFGRGVVALQIPIGEEKDFKGTVDLVRMEAHGNEERKTLGWADSGGSRRKGSSGREARRDGRRGGRRADGEVLRPETPRPRTSSRVEEGDRERGRSSRSFAPRPRRGLVSCGSWMRASPSCRLPRGAGPREPAKTASPPSCSPTRRTPPSRRSSRRSRIPSRAGSRTCGSSPGPCLRRDHWNAPRDRRNVSGRFLPQGKEHVSVPEALAGDIGAVAKLTDTGTGDTLTTRISRS